mgnify:CR=1 FL=1
MSKSRSKSLADAIADAPTFGGAANDRAMRFLAESARWSDDAALIAAVRDYAQAGVEYDDRRRELILAAEAAGIGVQYLDHEPSRARVPAADLARLHDLRREADVAHAAKRSATAKMTAIVTDALTSPEARAHGRDLVAAAESAADESARRADEAEQLLALAGVPLSGSPPYVSQASAHLINARRARESTPDRLHRLATDITAALADAEPEDSAVAS